MLNIYRTREVPPAVLYDDGVVRVASTREYLAFIPLSDGKLPGLVFIVGAGVSAEAYAPLLRPVAETGYTVYIVRLPWRIAPFATHKREAMRRVRAIIADTGSVKYWVLAGHSLGGALACRIVHDDPKGIDGLVLVGTTHPRDSDMSQSPVPVTKVYATNDGIAPVKKIEANRHLLPEKTRWVRIDGGNHAQFGNYATRQGFFDGVPTISREHQQDLTRTALLAALAMDR